MILNYIRIKFFFFLIIFLQFNLYALDVPEVKPRPFINQNPYSDVFDQIKKQNWIMAIKLADDHKNDSLSSYVRWLDITRPGSKHKFNYLENFYNNHKNWPKNKIMIEKIESSINSEIDSQKVLNWFKKNPPKSSKGSIEYLEALMRNEIEFNKKKNYQ